MIDNKYLFIRTDRIGDFLLSAILIKSIKRSDKNSVITVIASKKNYNYIKKFTYIDEVIEYPTKLLDKVKLYHKFFLKKHYMVAALDGKKRSIFLCIITFNPSALISVDKNLIVILTESWLESLLNQSLIIIPPE